MTGCTIALKKGTYSLEKSFVIKKELIVDKATHKWVNKQVHE